jgi:hypothetical protein
MTTAKKVVADDTLIRFYNKDFDLERRVREGTLDVSTVCTGLQTLIEGKTVLPDRNDIRQLQAFRLYDCGVGEDLGYSSFADYHETIPPIPTWPDHYGKHFDTVALVERRLGLKAFCNALGIRFEGNDETFVPHDPKRVKAEDVYWMFYQDGRKNHNKPVTICQGGFQKFEIGLDAPEGCCAYAQDRRHLLEEGVHVMDLPGSVRRGLRVRAACLLLNDSRPELLWRFQDNAVPHFGSASRGE